ncbi:hypothetical protein Goari_027403 [Gossypium aridum]|uniref:Uncharacterized protein n=1 Tax=Gossypium aridum TaxID=34290 RepID=A0A7J8YR20_GOSAI|nr:hypothetical protein [Gossypium aridum]
MFQIFDLSEKETFNWFMDRWKSWAKQELHQQGITELTVAMFKEVQALEKKSKGSIKCLFCDGLYIVKYCPKKFALSAIEGDDELEKASMKLGSILSSVEAKRIRENENKPMKCFLCCEEEVKLESEALKLGSMILNFAKAKRNHKQKGLVYVDINIISQRKSDLVNTRAFDLFILKKVIVNRDMRGGTKVLSAIQLAENVPYGKNIDLVDQSVTKTSLEMLEVQKINMKPVELSIV